jgi:putative ABC transport system substrate-binding protein
LPTKAFFEGLHDQGYDDGRNLKVESRQANGHFERLPELAQEIVRLNPDVIVAWVTAASIAAKKATATIPIVMGSVADPARAGLIASLARPGGNVTGTSGMSLDVAGKPLQLLHEAVPGARQMAVLWNPANRVYQSGMLEATKTAAEAVDITLQILAATTAEEIDAALQAISGKRVQALDILADPLFAIEENQRRIIEFAIRTRLPSVTATRGYAYEGGLMSYGPDYSAVSRRTAFYVARILKGAEPSDLPVEQATAFTFVINNRTARALGLTVPQSLLGRADEVIE